MMRPKERVLAAIDGEWVDRPPVCCMTTSVTVDQMRAADSFWPQAHTDAGEMADLAMAAHSVVGFESVRVPFCLTVEAEIMGAEVDLGTIDRTPMVKGHPLSMGDEIEVPADIGNRGRARVTLQSMRDLKDRVGEGVPVVPLATGPFTLAGHLVGMENLLLGIITDPDAAGGMVRGAAEVSRAYLEALDGAGADVVLLSNPSASADMISPEMHARFSLPHTRYCLEALESARSVLHICGNSTLHLENMIATGVDALSVEEKVDPYEAVRIVGGRAALVGNVGVVSPLLQGSRERVREHTLRVMDAGFDVVNPGCGLAPRIPLGNLREMVRTVKG